MEIYALLDCSSGIRSQRLNAALAFWRYASESAHWVFGDSLGDPTADEIWEMAKTNPHGVTRTQVSDLFSRNKKAREIDRALTRPRSSWRDACSAGRCGLEARAGQSSCGAPVCAAQAA